MHLKYNALALFLAFFIFVVGVHAQEPVKSEIAPVTVESAPLVDFSNPYTLMWGAFVVLVLNSFFSNRTVKTAIGQVEKFAGDLRDSIPPNIAENLFKSIPIDAIKHEAVAQVDPFLEKLKTAIPGEIDDQMIDGLKYVLANYDLSRRPDGTIIPVLKQ